MSTDEKEVLYKRKKEIENIRREFSNFLGVGLYIFSNYGRDLKEILKIQSAFLEANFPQKITNLKNHISTSNTPPIDSWRLLSLLDEYAIKIQDFFAEEIEEFKD